MIDDEFKPGDVVIVVADSTTGVPNVMEATFNLPIGTIYTVVRDMTPNNPAGNIELPDGIKYCKLRFRKATQLEKLLYLYGGRNK